MLNYVIIPVHGGRFAKVSRQDIDLVAGLAWYVGSRGAAIANPIPRVRGSAMIRMHRIILGEAAEGMLTEHINGDRLDNRRENLRLGRHKGWPQVHKGARKKAAPIEAVALSDADGNPCFAIALQGGGQTIVSPEDVQIATRHQLRVHKGYAACRSYRLHREILLAVVGSLNPSILCDHINGDPLDNRRCNLRACTAKQNARNGRSHRDSTSPFRGVSRAPTKSERWSAVIRANGKNNRLGSFNSQEAAAAAYNAAAIEHFGEFARLNVIPAKAA